MNQINTLPVRLSRDERDRGMRSVSSKSSSLISLLITTTGGGFCSGRVSGGGPGELAPRLPRRCLIANTRRRGIDMIITTSSSDICVTSTRLTARISSPT